MAGDKINGVKSREHNKIMQGWSVWVLGVMVVGVCGTDVIKGNADVMKDVTLGFGEALESCREQSELPEEIMQEIFHFWREDFRFEHRQLGCAFHCMSRHYNLLTDDHRMHHENTHRFIHSFPNGEQLSHQMVSIIHACEQKHDSEPDHCWRMLRVAECFKVSCQQQGIAPNMEMLMAEFIMEADAEGAAA